MCGPQGAHVSNGSPVEAPRGARPHQHERGLPLDSAGTSAPVQDDADGQVANRDENDDPQLRLGQQACEYDDAKLRVVF